MSDTPAPRTNRRAKLPLAIRRKIQKVVRNFVFLGITYMTVYHAYITITEYRKVGDVMKHFGFVPGIVWQKMKTTNDFKNEKKTSVTDLPVEIWTKVFSYLKPSNIIVAQNVCTLWFCIIQNFVSNGLIKSDYYVSICAP